MTMYNMLFGENPSTDEILALLGLTEDDVERFRCCWIKYDAEYDEEPRIVILARTGGDNREQWPNEKLTSHPCYIRDYDDDWDATYACYEFVMPEEVDT